MASQKLFWLLSYKATTFASFEKWISKALWKWLLGHCALWYVVRRLIAYIPLNPSTLGQNSDSCNIRASPSIWNKVIKRLSEAQKWDLINLLLGLSPVKCTVLDGKARGCGAGGVNLGPLIDSLRDMSVTSWQQNLAVALLKDGAGLDTIRGSGNDPPVHVALAAGLRSGNQQIFIGRKI